MIALFEFSVLLWVEKGVVFFEKFFAAGPNLNRGPRQFVIRYVFGMEDCVGIYTDST